MTEQEQVLDYFTGLITQIGDKLIDLTTILDWVQDHEHGSTADYAVFAIGVYEAGRPLLILLEDMVIGASKAHPEIEEDLRKEMSRLTGKLLDFNEEEAKGFDWDNVFGEET